jgi:hemoglobin-like flavoprotein
MTTREKQLVRESFQSIREEAGPVALLFYGRLFALEPALRPMFHGDIARQGQKLMDMLAVTVESLDRFHTMTQALHAIGQRHTSYGVLPRHYEIVQAALIWALGQALATTSGSDVLAAWRTLITEVSALMLAGADQLTVPPEKYAHPSRTEDSI